ncbi:TrmB family transcriptional regulator [Natronorarus salvus]|uniref:TrmB family transcriptional regulator n=1 Tax=Natronorarus salvus TaxID=3117733 RepID=UPI002F25EDAE
MSTKASYNHTEVAIDDLPTELESSGSKLVYLYLDLTGDATINELEATLGMRKLALYPVLDTLSAAGLVERDGEAFTAA